MSVDTWYSENTEGGHRYRVTFAFVDFRSIGGFSNNSRDERFYLDYQSASRVRFSNLVKQWFIDNVEGADLNQDIMKASHRQRPVSLKGAAGGTVRFKSTKRIKVGHTSYVSTITACFERKEDALLFKLTWT